MIRTRGGGFLCSKTGSASCPGGNGVLAGFGPPGARLGPRIWRTRRRCWGLGSRTRPPRAPKSRARGGRSAAWWRSARAGRGPGGARERSRRGDARGVAPASTDPASPRGVSAAPASFGLRDEGRAEAAAPPASPGAPSASRPCGCSRPWRSGPPRSRRGAARRRPPSAPDPCARGSARGGRGQHGPRGLMAQRAPPPQLVAECDRQQHG